MKKLLLVLLMLLSMPVGFADVGVELRRLPANGFQSRAVMDAHGRLHVVYYTGAPKAGNLWYVSSTDAGRSWAPARRVNSVENSAVASGNVRGVQLAVSADGRVHVAWNGSMPSGGFLYARSDRERKSFSAQWAAQGATTDMDGGGDVVSAGSRVYLVWHAVPHEGGPRRVFMRVSDNDGGTFSAERPISDSTLGCCECCGLRATVGGGGAIYVLYRAAKGGVERDIWCLSSTDAAASFHARRLDGWRLNGCPVTTISLVGTPDGALGAWETMGQIWMARLTPTSASAPVAASGTGQGRKHPAVCQSASGDVLLAWIEGMSYGSGGRLGWQQYDHALRPRSAAPHGGETVPAWDLLAAFFDGRGFTLLY